MGTGVTMSLTMVIAKIISLQLPDLSRDFVLQTDGSDYYLGVVLLQEHSSVLKSVAFASHILTHAEKKFK